jgi:penicillin-binding protein 1A
MAGMPKGRTERALHRLNPKNLYHYWFSREGGIMALKIVGIGFIAGFLLLVGMFAYFRKDLPNLRDISGENLGGSIQYYDRTGKTLLWEDYDAAKRIPVESEEISDSLKKATVAIEDKDFYKHGGFDVRGISRAAWNNAFGGSTQGGSTITQQLVKLTQNWTQERTVTRKVKEVILAVELERSYSKDEILTGYLNTAPYGGIEYGAEAAARDYFNKSADELTLPEATMLATIPQSPRYYSPYSQDFDKERFSGRQFYVLDQMVEQGMITKDQAEKAKKVNVVKTVKPRKAKYAGIKAPWFVLAAKNQIQNKIASETADVGGWKVTTTLDLGLQKKAEEAIASGIGQVYAQGGDNAAMAAEDVETGQMVALVGGVDFTNKEYGQINYAQTKLPPGSSYKPYDYLSLIENQDNFGAGSVLYDTQGPLEGYPCTNKQRPKNGGNCLYDYDFRYPGPVTLRYGLGGSRNVPAVKAMLINGIDKTIETSEKLGLRSGYKCYRDQALEKEGECYASAAIGDGAFLKLDEHVHAQASISRGGKYIEQTYILEINDATEKPVYKWKKEKPEQIVREDSAYIISDIMSDPKASYMSRKSHRYNDWKFALKTGTTNDGKDGWLTGFSTKYSASVWVGHHTRQVELGGFMETMTQPIWNSWMQGAHDGKKAKDWKRPSGVKEAPAYVVRNHVGVASIEPSPSNDLYPSWYKNNKKKTASKRTIDIVSNKLATSCTPSRAKKTLTETDASSFSGDTYVDAGGANTNQNDDVHKCSDAKPRISLTVQKQGSSYNLIATVSQGTHPLSSTKFPGKVTFAVGGSQLPGGSRNISSPGTVVYKNYKPTFSGTKTVTATVVDSVLYDASDSANVTGTTGSGSIEDFEITSTTSSTISLRWASYPGASSYTITITNGEPGSCSSAGTNTANCTGLTPGTLYSFRVKANGVSGSPSATTSGSTL